MIPKIAKQFGEMELRRLQFVDQVQYLPTEKLSWRPRSNGWSVLEILQHIVLSEREVLIQPVALRSLSLKRSPVSLVKFYLVLLVLRLNIPVNVPSTKMEPTGSMKLPEILRQWEQLRNHLRHFLPHATETTARYPVFWHPAAGMLDTFQMITLARWHLIQHKRQVSRLLHLIG